RDHIVPWDPHSDGVGSTCIVPKTVGASRHMHLISKKHLMEELSCHGRLPIEGASEREEPVAEGIGRCGLLAAVGASSVVVKDRFRTEETKDDAILSREGSVTIKHKDGVCPLCSSSAADLVWASTGDGRGRWTSVPDRSVEEEQRRLVGMC
ncbi:hypothetical protein GW17_00061602, partial [Ensete ventricosum]